MFKKISHIISDYKVKRIRMEKVINFKSMLKATLGAILINLVIFLIPALLIYNLFILEYLQIYLIILIFILLITFTFMYNILLIKILKNYHDSLNEINFKNLVIVESAIQSLILVFLLIAILIII